MGSDYSTFLEEGKRVLRMHGYFWIAEVRSRFVPVGSDFEDFEPFLSCLRGLGFRTVKQDLTNRMFVIWVLKKTRQAPLKQALAWPKLGSCIYKRR
jgi:hypothetical protein